MFYGVFCLFFKLVRIGRIVTYLPDLRIAVLRCRSFSSATNELGIQFYDAPENNTGELVCLFGWFLNVLVSN